MNRLNEAIYNMLLEKFGEKIGDAPSTVGVPDERDEMDEAGSMTISRVARPLGELEEGRKKKKGPSKKTAKKILKGTKTFKDKMKKVSGWADDPASAAAWMMHKATGKWPSEKLSLSVRTIFKGSIGRSNNEFSFTLELLNCFCSGVRQS